MSDQIERFEFDQDADEAAEVSEFGPWVRYSDHRSVVERLEGKLQEAEDRFQSCDHCERPSREEDLETIWCRDAESGDQVERSDEGCRAKEGRTLGGETQQARARA